MNATTERQPTCAERVAAAAESRLEDLRAMLDPCAEDLTLEQDGSCFVLEVLDRTVAELSRVQTFDITGESLPGDLDNMDADTWETVLAALFDEFEDEIREAGCEAFNEYGLAFDYVEPETFPDQKEGYFRYQISFGGPSEEIRFYASRASFGWHLYRAEFWYLDWFDGAPQIVTHDERARAVWDEFDGSGLFEHVFNQAMED